ncbi:MAG: toll/interleukin-1 receptor domain-containing protein [Hyphomicrobiaceae bacterium]
MLAGWLPDFCTRLNIFLSYSSEYRALAESIAQSLKNDGHQVFFDKDSLPPGGDYNERIRKAIRSSDRFLFLASRSALESGKYTLTELDFARQRWPSPVGRVLPVLVDPELKPEALPAYLASVHALSIAGNAPAEIVAAIERTGRVSPLCRACVVLSTLAIAGIIGLATGFIPLGPRFTAADIALVAPEYVHFRARARPPDNPSAPGADQSWSRSPITLTLPVAYSHRHAGAAPAQLLKEEATLMLEGRKNTFAWAYVVEFIGDSIAGQRCADWLCQKAAVKVENVMPGTTTPTRETMFLPTSGSPLLWRDFMDRVLAPDGPKEATVTLTYAIVVADKSKRPDIVRTYTCHIDVAGARQAMLRGGYKPGQDPRPPVWQPRCRKP